MGLVLQQKYKIMAKLNYYVFIILINIIGLTTKAQINSNLEITGSALLNNEHVGDYSISVYFDGTRIDSIYTKSKEPVKLRLSTNHKFTILFQKQDCLDKIVIVNTKISSDLKNRQDSTFEFKISMRQILNDNSKDFEANQVAVLVINEKEELLETSTSYDKFHKESDGIIGVPNNTSPVYKNLDK